MGYVDLVDFDKKISQYFPLKSCLKNGIKSFFGILDFMLYNGCFAWNMSAKVKGIIGTK